MAGEVIVTGDKEIERLLKGFPEKLVRRFLAAGMRRIGQATTKRAKPKARKRRSGTGSGTLARSVGHRVYRSRTRPTVGVVIGPRKGFGRWVVRETIGKRKKRLRRRAVGRKEDWSKLRSARRWADPTNYGHLVEKGFTHKQAGRITGQPYMAPSLNPSEALAILKAGMREAINKVRT
jgi:hypothetical protein